MSRELEERVTELESELVKVKKRSTWIFGICATIFSFFNASVLSKIDHFKKIFDDLLDGEPLPGLTNLVLGFGHYLMYSNLLLPFIIIGICLKFKKLAPILLGTLIISLCIELLVVIIAYFLPMISTINKM
jgi:hypothetical protein